MGIFSFFRSGRAQQPAPAEAPDPGTAGSPYSRQYEVIVGQGHDHPTPFFNAPALVWHVGVWPKKAADPHDNVSGTGAALEIDAYTSIDNRESAFNARRLAWVREINALLKRLQHWRWPTSPANPVKIFASARDPRTGEEKAPEAGSVVFTMWWKSDAATQVPDPAALRIKVHCNLTPDFVTFSFYVDIATLWGGDSAQVGQPASVRRARILQAITDIERICRTHRATQGPRHYAQVHADRLEALDDDALLAARNRLYVDVWEEFIAEAGCSLEALSGACGEIFANFRGVVLAVPDVDDTEPAHERFPRFSDDPRFDIDGTEANGIVDTYWPFVRRIVPSADYREFVACGLLGWRALYITALGSPALFDENEERPRSRGDKTEADIRIGEDVPDRLRDTCVRPCYSGSGHNHPVRYLMLTKAGLNPRQLGRIVERINALGTLRLYALKDWATIVHADTTIRTLGQELDLLTRDWSEKRKLLDELKTLHLIVHARNQERYRPIAKYLVHVKMPWRLKRMYAAVKRTVSRLFGEAGEFMRREDVSKLLDIKYAALAEISSELEERLIAISDRIDRLSLEATGGLHFRISRSAIHVAEFNQLLELLQVGNMQTWTSYEQFVKRGLSPAFKFIEEAGRRMVALRTRLISVLETIETSALVGQSSATRHNTGELRRIMNYVIGFIVLYLILNKRQLFEAYSLLKDLVQKHLDPSVIAQYYEAFMHLWK